MSGNDEAPWKNASKDEMEPTPSNEKFGLGKRLRGIWFASRGNRRTLIRKAMYYVLLFSVLGGAIGVVQIPILHTTVETWFENSAHLTAEGLYDRVELVERMDSGAERNFLGLVRSDEFWTKTTMLVPKHYNCESNRDAFGYRHSYYPTGKNYPMYIYVYIGKIHIREPISVVGGISEEFVYENVTVIIDLSVRECIFEDTVDYSPGVSLTLFVCVGVMIYIKHKM